MLPKVLIPNYEAAFDFLDDARQQHNNTIEEAYQEAEDIYEAQWKIDMTAAEMIFYRLHHRLPEWAVIIYRVEQHGDSTLFIHRGY